MLFFSYADCNRMWDSWLVQFLVRLDGSKITCTGQLNPLTLLHASETVRTDSRGSQLGLVRRQLRFSMPNAHDRIKASFSSCVRLRVSATRRKKSTGI